MYIEFVSRNLWEIVSYDPSWSLSDLNPKKTNFPDFEYQCFLTRLA